MHNGKYHTESYKQKQVAKLDNKFGPSMTHTKTCKVCGKVYEWTGRKLTKAYEKSQFCSRSCANNRTEWWKDNATDYRTIAFRHYKKECAICGFDKIVAVHHRDEDRSNNQISNLVPLCPNHHEMIHCKEHRDEVIGELVKWDHVAFARLN